MMQYNLGVSGFSMSLHPHPRPFLVEYPLMSNRGLPTQITVKRRFVPEASVHKDITCLKRWMKIMDNNSSATLNWKLLAVKQQSKKQ